MSDLSLPSRIVQADAANIESAAKLIQQGKVVAFPTETVYGLGANALDTHAVARIFEIKNRPIFDPLIVHIPCFEDADRLAASFPGQARKLAQAFWPGPLTIVVPKRKNVPGLVTADLPGVGIRVPQHPVALELLKKSGLPIAAPSANPFGGISPTKAQHVHRHIPQGIDLILDAGACSTGLESTVISFMTDQPILLRPGGLSVEEIQQVIGPIQQPPGDPDHPLAPGQLAKHYSPRTPMRLLPPLHTSTHPASISQKKPPPISPWPSLPAAMAGNSPSKTDQTSGSGGTSGGISGGISGGVGLLAFQGQTQRPGYAAVEVLSPRGDLREAAANLFAMMHRLDEMGLDFIVAEIVPDTGLGKAINDRLRRAAAATNTTFHSP